MTKKLSTYEQIKAMLQETTTTGEVPTTPQNNAPSTNTKALASDSTRNYYLKVCKQKHVQPLNGYEMLTQKSLSDEIKVAQQLPNWAPASTAQINRLEKTFASCKLHQPNLTQLSISDASEMIKKLDKIYQEKYAHIPTEKQLDFINKMMLCPDIDSSNLAGIPVDLVESRSNNIEEIKLNNSILDRIFSMKQKAITSKESEVLKDLEKAERKTNKLIKKLESEQVELTESIDKFLNDFDIATLTKIQCSDFIKSNQAVYYKWNRDRASEGQRELINTLRVRIGDEILSPEALIQFDRKTAENYITQLQIETSSKPSIPQEETYEDTDRTSRFPKTLADAEEAFHKNVRDVIFKLCAVIGQNAEDNPIFESANFNSEFEDLIKTVYVYTTKSQLIDILSPVISEGDVLEILA